MPDQAERMRQIAERYRRPLRPHVITVTSGKGGAGKSTVALNLAIAFCDLGKRVILLDADSNLGGLDVMLKLSPHTALPTFSGTTSTWKTRSWPRGRG